MQITPLGERLVKITLSGRLDTQGVDRVETKFISAIVPGSNNAVIDLSGVDFVASMGIRMLVSVARSLKTRQAQMVIVGTMPQVAEVFEAVSLHKIIVMRPTEIEALEALSAPPA